MNIPLDSRAEIPPDVLSRVVEGELVILNLTDSRYFGLDPVGARMWEALTTAPSVGAACEALAREFEVEPARLQLDVAGLAAELGGRGLLRFLQP